MTHMNFQIFSNFSPTVRVKIVDLPLRAVIDSFRKKKKKNFVLCHENHLFNKISSSKQEPLFKI